MALNIAAWRNTIVARLKDQVTFAKAVVPTSKVEVTISSNTWESPTLFLEFEKIEFGPNKLIGQAEQNVKIPVNVYVAVRTGLIAPEGGGPLEYDEDAANEGVFDISAAVVNALQYYEVQSTYPIMKLFPLTCAPWADADEIVIWKCTFDMLGGLATHS